MSKTNSETWNIKKMREYASIQYNLYTSPESWSAYEKQMRRVLKEKKLVSKDKNTGYYNYELSELDAKHFIDVTMRDYFESNASNGKAFHDFYAKKDDELNAAYPETSAEYYDHCSDEDNFYNIPSAEEVDASIDRFMLRALFSQLYYFEEEKYREDYCARQKLVDGDAREPYAIGFSEVDKKLKNPLGHYCVKK